MTVPAQKDLFTKRYRRVRQLEPLEYQTQIALNQLLKLVLRDDRVEYYHTPNGELRDIRIAAKLRAMGVRPGVADFTFLWPELVSVVAEPHLRKFPQILYLELKRRGEDLSEEQEQFRDSVTAKGAYYEVAHSLDEAVEILKKYGILTKIK